MPLIVNRRAGGWIAAAALAAGVFTGVFAASKEFLPDVVFKGSTLTGWHPVGQADWRAETGEIIGTARPGGSGGWLMLDKSLQDVAVFTSFKCAADCKAGLLLRAEKTADGM